MIVRVKLTRTKPVKPYTLAFFVHLMKNFNKVKRNDTLGAAFPVAVTLCFYWSEICFLLPPLLFQLRKRRI